MISKTPKAMLIDEGSTKNEYITPCWGEKLTPESLGSPCLSRWLDCYQLHEPLLLHIMTNPRFGLLTCSKRWGYYWSGFPPRVRVPDRVSICSGKWEERVIEGAVVSHVILNWCERADIKSLSFTCTAKCPIFLRLQRSHSLRYL